MAEATAISWCDSTFNPWVGCTKLSLACDHCYAERLMDHRLHRVQWGPGQPRQRTSAANWRQPLLWEREHEAFMLAHGRRRRVFCASLADVFDNEVPPEWRADLFGLIQATPHLDWQLLTKRIGNAWKMMADACGWSMASLKLPLPNVWLGATICNQAEADRDIPKLLAVPARVRFLSIEPMLGPIDLFAVPRPRFDAMPGAELHVLPNLDWVICGGESGPQARPMHPDWVRSLRDQCAAAGVPFHVKQWGEWTPDPDDDRGSVAWGITTSGELLKNNAAFNARTGDAEVMFRVGTKHTGRLLDGRTHDEFPSCLERAVVG
jgi:protein gp37